MNAIFDSHLDLALNALGLNRNLLESLATLNEREAGMTDHPCRSHATLTFPEMRRARVAVCCATLLARAPASPPPPGGYARYDLDFAAPEIAHSFAMAQLGYYEVLESMGVLEPIRNGLELEKHWDRWRTSSAAAAAGENDTGDAGGNPSAGSSPAIGNILSMEGSDPIIDPDWVPFWFERGLRVASLVHYGWGRYAAGTGADGPITGSGRNLLRAFRRSGIILDLTHISDQGFFQAIEMFDGPVMASHNNCRALVPGDRQFTDDQIRVICERNGVIGVACDAWMLYPGWRRGVTRPDVLSIDAIADHIDHICTLCGDTRHAAIGTDLDGLYGHEQTPRELKSIVDLGKLDSILEHRGYTAADREAVLFGNWYGFFSAALPRAAHS